MWLNNEPHPLFCLHTTNNNYFIWKQEDSVSQRKMSARSGLAEVMNQSLTPTKVGQPFSPSNYPDKKSVVAAYKRMVRNENILLVFMDMH